MQEINVSDSLRCIFVHVPKTAGTSIKSLLDLPGRGHPTWRYFAERIPDKWRDYLKFAVVRDPYDRFLSAYRYARMDRSHWHDERNPHPDRHLLHDRDPLQCCRLLERQRASLHHESWHPQTLWICDERGRLVVDLLLRMERLQEDFAALCARLGIAPVELPVTNPSRDAAGAQSAVDDVEIRRAVERIYARDYRLLDYPVAGPADDPNARKSPAMTATTASRPATAKPATNTLSHNTEQLLEHLRAGRHDAICEHLLATLEFFKKSNHTELDTQTRYFVDVFVRDLLFVFTQPKFVVGERFAKRFVMLNPVISNLVAMTALETTDGALEILLDPRHRNNLVKVLALYSARNRTVIEHVKLFDANPQLACLWYSMYFSLYTSVLADRTGLENFRRHLRYADERLDTFYNFHDIYFSVTYADPVNDRALKRRINESLRRQLAHVAIRNRPGRSADGRLKIAVFSDLWHERHSVYRNQAEFIDTLKEDYHLTFVHMEFADRDRFDTRIFDEVLYLGNDKGGLNLEPITDNDFTIAYFPDVGMTMKSIMCANLRIAPIQVCGVGHSVSTFGSLIDYYVSGADVELPEGAEENYSERLVLLPGYGIVHNAIDYRPTRPDPRRDRFVINCPWYSQKTNHEMLQLLRRVVERVDVPLLFRFFPGGSLAREDGHVPFVRAVAKVLDPATFEVYPGMPYDRYMALMEQGEITIDAFPFGGCNTVADSLHLRKPTLTYEGRSWYNRIGSQMLKSIGQAELVATGDDEYVDKCVRLIADRDYRAGVARQLETIDVDGVIFSDAGRDHFKRAIDYLVANHERLRAETTRDPIRVAGLPPAAESGGTSA